MPRSKYIHTQKYRGYFLQKSGPRKDLLRLTLLNKRPPIFVSAAEEYALKTRHTEYISIMNTICFRCISYQKGLESIIFAVFCQILGKLSSLAQGYKTRHRILDTQACFSDTFCKIHS